MAYIIGIGGGSASGKSTLIRRLTEAFNPGEVAVVSQDHYYRPVHEQKRDESGEVNFDLPESIDNGRFIFDIETLESGVPVTLTEYTYNAAGREPSLISILPAPVLLVEGLFIFEDPVLTGKMDLRVFVDARDDIKLSRRLQRDSTERGLSEDVIRYQWENHVKPAYERYLLPHREDVDLIVMNNTHFENSLKVLSDHIAGVLRAQEPL